MKLSNYKPNFQDKRFVKRALTCMTWAENFLDHSEGKTLHHETLRAIFGTASNPVSAYLRSQLLIQVGSYSVGARSFAYILNTQGLDNLKQKLNPDEAVTRTVIDKHFEKHAEELTSLEFQYTEKSNRLWHPLQNLKRTAKVDFWKRHGMPYNYDIQACAPTLLMQAAVYFKLPEVCLENIQYYIKNREQERARLAALLDIPEKDAKRLLNSLFNGAKLAANTHCSAYATLGFDKDKMEILQNDQQIMRLRSEVKRLWKRIEQCSNYSFKKSSMKWRFYFGLERMVMDVVRKCLDEAGVKHFDEHDGFRTNKPIDMIELQNCIERNTPFRFKVILEAEHDEIGVPVCCPTQEIAK